MELIVAFSPNGELLASGSWDGTINLWRRDGTSINTIKAHTLAIREVAFSPDGKTLVSGSDDKTVKLWKLDGKLIKTLEGHTHKVRTVGFSPDGKTIISGSDNNTVKFWRKNTPSIPNLTTHGDSVWSVAFSPNGEIIASGGRDNTVKLSLRDGTLITTLQGHKNYINTLTFSSDGKTLLSGSSDKTIALWNLDGSLIRNFPEHTSSILAVAFSDDDRKVLSATSDKKVHVWHKDGQSITSFPLEGHSSKINAISFSPDAKTVASGGADAMVKLWNLDGSLIATLEGHASEINTIAFSPDGKTIASGSKDKMVKLWNLDGSLIATLESHASEVNAIAFSPDGKTIASGSSDNTVKLWQPDSTLIHTFLSHNGPIYALAFSPDGKTLVSGSEDSTVKLWNLNLPDLINRGCTWLEEYNISRPDRFSQLESCQNPQRLQASALSLVAQGEQLVKTGKFEEAIHKFERAKQWNLKLTFDSQRKAVPALVKQAENLVLEGKRDEAIYKLKEAQTLDPNLDLNPDTKEVETDAEIVANQFTAVKKRGEATTLAREGNLDEAIARFEEAQTLDPNLDLNLSTAEVETDAATVAKQFAADKKHEEGTKLVKEGQLDKAIAKFKEAQNLNPDIDLISDNSDEQYKQPEMAVRYLAAIEKFKKGESSAKKGEIDEAIALFKEAQNLDPNVKKASSWNTLCRFGALQGRAAAVLFACETAVSLEAENAVYQDSRGLARALTGNIEGAIEDFQAFLDSINNNSAQFWRKEWIYSLRNDKNPFTEQELQRLLEE
ncbi:WD40 domain-containing protein [Oxynema aestuarii]|uniref:WD40 domain-containing protein n=1 Tax=Oxynema aestuarii TaxID=2874213 RepID=UPI001FE91976|nr:hypothetical protein [Oxynema aestuarii]